MPRSFFKGRLIDLIEAIGLPGAMKFIGCFGGMRIYLPLPENVDAGNDIAKAIGVDSTRVLARLWSQTYVDVPMASCHLRESVRCQICRDREHMTVREIARKYETHERSIYRILAKAPRSRPR